MCTAISYISKDHYFGRNLDLHESFLERVVIFPRNMPLPMRHEASLHQHYAMIGMAAVLENYPLYYDATNEYGLSIAALNFPGNACYFPLHKGKQNITPFEFIPWILGQCKTVSEARTLLCNLNFADTPFHHDLPLSPLHWLIADKNESLTVEPTEHGVKVYDNTIGVLTNNPPFEYHLHHLAEFLNITNEQATNRFAPSVKIKPYSNGMGGIGLPGDLSSASRFVKAAFTKLNSPQYSTEDLSVSQFFHILESVYQQEGCAKVGEKFEKTIYTSCCNTKIGIYYYKTYENSQITAINLFGENLDGYDLVSFPLHRKQQYRWEN